MTELRGDAWDRVPAWLRGLDPGALTLAELLTSRVALAPSRPLVAMGGEELSAAETLRRALLWTRRFEDAGVLPGEHIAIMARNRLDFLLAVLGAALGGVVPVVVNAELRAAQLEHVLGDSRPRVVVADAAALELLADVDRSTVAEFWSFDPTDRAWCRPVPGAGRPGAIVAATSASPFVVIYTSGTTGLPKGVTCPQAQFFWWGVNTGAELGLTTDDVLHTTLPLFHTNALSAFFQALVFNARLVLAERFSASRFWRDLADSGATVTFVLGAMISILARRDRAEYDPSHRVRVALAPATPPALAAVFAEEFSVDLLEGYGSTETNHVISTPRTDRRPGWMGCVLPGYQARVVDRRGVPVPAGTPGELVLRHTEPYSVAQGYLNAPEKTLAAWRDQWFHTGDLVVGSAEGWFRFVDRLTDSLRRRGENVSTFEVEAAVSAHPAVRSAAAFGVPSELGEQDVMVVVTAAAGLDAVELVAFCRTRLARFAVPRYVRVVEAMPLTETDKIRKSALRAEGVTADTVDMELVEGATR